GGGGGERSWGEDEGGPRPPQRVDQPACGAQEPAVGVAGADELRAERQAVRAGHQWHAERRHTAEGPQRAEDGIAGGGETRWRDTGGPGREQRVVFLLEQLGETVVQPRNLGERFEVTRRGMIAAPLDSAAEPLRKTRAALVPFTREVHRDFDFHDEAVPVPRLLDRSWQLDLLDAVTEALDQLREHLLRVVIEPLPMRRLHEAERRGGR